MMGAAATMVIGVPYFLMLDTRSACSSWLAIVIWLIPHDMQYGPQAALIAESFPTRRRYSGAGLGYQLASVFAGGPAPLLARGCCTATTARCRSASTSPRAVS